ncbi:class I SAM-dependent methyltransferase [Methylobacterium oryzae]|uniref:class I SAM-dependent methyltransferase n=1 Tax=Methylobacterium oryzae TaxID=334852 RepID=UPI002F350551
MRSSPWEGMEYGQFMSHLVTAREAQVYLEVGVQQGLALSRIAVKTAYGVDPGFMLSVDPTTNKQALHLYRMTSDAFFRDHSHALKAAGGIDFAFLDGMHLFEYLLRDVYNTERNCRKSSVIALHDCLPFNSEMIERVNNYAARTPGPHAAAWTGDVWKVVKILEKYRPDLQITAVDCAPTGLICISNLDPSSTILEDRYNEIINEWRDVPNNADAMEDFYSNRVIYSAEAIISNFNQSSYFRI